MAKKTKKRAAPTRKVLTMTQLTKKPTKKIDVSKIISESQWLIAAAGGDVDDLIVDLGTWQAELEAIVEKHGEGLDCAMLTSEGIEEQRAKLKKLFK